MVVGFFLRFEIRHLHSSSFNTRISNFKDFGFSLRKGGRQKTYAFLRLHPLIPPCLKCANSNIDTFL
ncbi:hypothetical protein I7I50_10925 [Histoplasma capsulatum G186AR]|uniref:Uncharacterized protein n=1 Tax=Ajellomyces capsulatus TaxID=5037 RepID=A0A8H7Z7H7_AJECA|nr:hypothetical protein I7I52_02163 [Histoplasma capsulatum]QSS69585.1 hypothetical protein I7I50_10925 [Histoplasma capsulatum G186AR]